MPPSQFPKCIASTIALPACGDHMETGSPDFQSSTRHGPRRCSKHLVTLREVHPWGAAAPAGASATEPSGVEV